MEKNRKPTISVVVSAYNEEAKLSRCLSSVRWVDEIIVVDSASTDKTASIARKFTPTVWRRPNNPMLNVNKNFGFTKASGDWILCLDADEEVPKELATELRAASGRQSPITGYWIARKNIIFGRWLRHGLWWPDRQLRFFRRGQGLYPCQHIHEYIAVDGPTGQLVEPYVHYNYESVSQYLWKMDSLYTEDEVKRLIATGYQVTWHDAIRFPFSDFVKNYFSLGGYRDGLHGLVLCMLQAIYAFLVFAKLWERRGFAAIELSLPVVSEEFKRRKRELTYWQLTAHIRETSNPLIKLFLRFGRRYGR